MQSLFFTLASYRKLGLSFVTHRGSSIALQPGCSTKMEIPEDEPMTLPELVEYYDSRYKREGLQTRILGSEPTVNGTSISDIKPEVHQEPVNPTVVTPTSQEEEKQQETKVEESAPEKTETPLDDISDVNSEGSISEETVVETKTEGTPEVNAEEVAPEAPVAEWDFDKMRDFVKDHNLELKGRSKPDYIEAIEAFLKKED